MRKCAHLPRWIVAQSLTQPEHTISGTFMKNLTLLFVSLILYSCDDQSEIDTYPPAAPRGIRTVSLDNAVEIAWLANTEPDVDGYNVWKSDRYDGRYDFIGSTTGTSLTDFTVNNGVTRYYAVSSYDFS